MDSTNKTVDGIKKEPVPPPPDGGYGWVVVFASFMLSWLVDGMLYAYGVMKLPLQEAFKTSEGLIVFVGSLCVGVYMLLGPVFSNITEKYGFRSAIIGGSILTSATMAISTLSTNAYAMMLTYGVGAGFGYGLVYLASLGVLNTYFDKKLNLVNGIVASGTGVGVLSFGQISGYLFDEYGWRGGMLILAGIMLNGVVLGALMKPVGGSKKTKKENPIPIGEISNNEVLHIDTRDTYEPVPTDENDANQQPRDVLILSKESVFTKLKSNIRFDLLRNPSMLLLCLGQVFGMFGYYLVVLLLVSVAEREIKATPFQSRMTMTALGIANTIARALFGWMATCDKISALLISNITLTICALASFLFIYVKTYAHIMAFSIMFGICSAPYVGLTISCLKEILRKDNYARQSVTETSQDDDKETPARNGGDDDYVAGLGILFLFRGVSCVAGPTLGGILTDATGSYRLAFVVGAAGLLLAALLQILIPIHTCWRRKRTALPSEI